MLKGTRVGVVRKIQPVSIHGQISLDLYIVYDDDPDQVRIARLGPEAVQRRVEAGDRVDGGFSAGRCHGGRVRAVPDDSRLTLRDATTRGHAPARPDTRASPPHRSLETISPGSVRCTPARLDQHIDLVEARVDEIELNPAIVGERHGRRHGAGGDIPPGRQHHGVARTAESAMPDQRVAGESVAIRRRYRSPRCAAGSTDRRRPQGNG